MCQIHLIADPCINICRMDQGGKLCQGCKRTALEIGAWPRMTEPQKAQVLGLIEQRMNALFAPAHTRVQSPHEPALAPRH